MCAQLRPPTTKTLTATYVATRHTPHVGNTPGWHPLARVSRWAGPQQALPPPPKPGQPGPGQRLGHSEASRRSMLRARPMAVRYGPVAFGIAGRTRHPVAWSPGRGGASLHDVYNTVTFVRGP